MKIIYIILLFFLVHLRVYSEEKKPVEILADSMEWNKELSQAVATGNAKAIQGQTTIEANKIVAVLNEDNSQQITELRASGNIKFLKEKQEATGDEAIYYLSQDKVVITGNVELKKDGSIIKGEKLIIDFITGLSKMENSDSNQKVKMKYVTE